LFKFSILIREGLLIDSLEAIQQAYLRKPKCVPFTIEELKIVKNISITPNPSDECPQQLTEHRVEG